MNKKQVRILLGNLLVLGLVLTGGKAFAQKVYADYDSYSPVFAVKTNLLYWAAATPNIGLEIGTGKRTSLEIAGNYNPWTFSENTKMKHWLVQPEFRLWTCEKFNGHFFGVHLHGGEFNFGHIRQIPFLKEHRYEGYFYGAGISYGYQWILGKRWNLEATLGIGYARMVYDKYECQDCGRKLDEGTKNYFGPTKAGITFIYIIK